ncbi:MAG: HEAT repeat domain-containing protein [Polyangiaceae bacterium]|nr:HEAT repeat domain-containing protein [Polyangiaceae bacterium]
MSALSKSVRARLADPETEVRRLATQDIPRLPVPESCELLLVALGDEDWRVRKEAASVACRVEPRTQVVFTVASALTQRDDVGLRNAAVEALVRIGPDSVPAAVEALGRLDADGRKLAVEILAGAPTLGGMRALATALDDEDPNVMVAAAEGLGRAHLAGDEARERAGAALVGVLDENDIPLRLAALGSLRALAFEIPWAALEPLFDEPLLKRPAIGAAGASRVPRAVHALAEAVSDPNATISREAIVALGRSIEQAWGDDELLDVAAKTLCASADAHARLRDVARDDVDAGARGAALLALGLVKDPSDISLLADALAADDVTDFAEAALRRFGRDAVMPLLVAGRTAEPSLRGATISMLPELAPAESLRENASLASESLAALRCALSDASEGVVVAALKSLSMVGGAVDLAPVARRVNDVGRTIVSGAASSALREITRRHPADARRLLAGVDPRGDAALVATIALETLAQIGQTRAADAAFLESALTHRDARVRRGAVDALAAMGGEEAAAAVSLSLADEAPLVAEAAIRALGRLGRAEQLASLAASTRDPLRLGTTLRALGHADPERAFAAAKPLVCSHEASVAMAAVEVVGEVVSGLRALGEVETARARADALMDATAHPDHEVVKVALARLASVKDERTLFALGRALEHPADVVRRYAAEIVGQENSAEAESLLHARLDREPSAEVRRAIMEALSARADLGAGA